MSKLNIYVFLILYLSFQNIYKCIKIGKQQNKVHNNNVRLESKFDNLSSKWSNKGYNFMDLLKNGYLKNKGNLDDVKDNLADELANKIQNKIEDYLKEENNMGDIENFTDEDLNDLKIYVKDISEYVGLKAADLLDKNLEEALKPILTKKAFDSFENNLNNKIIDDVEYEENPNDENVNEETETFVNELVNDYENNQLDSLDQYEKEIKTHNNLD
ncbi:protein of early gametocyte 3 male development gene, putative [Plasmodium gallinaceum]|uniref:Protein of early gametocyte 3 male development gene, putative n=1 Tax=Plasmodium gallinaceum TaxID=5849 RepID=A0A1J1H320_PLAGA|nr:protein of early gametocyte 3 male development gene, putative [Plasmodium gallinaceum]CRG97734.1 protein of early gametocyte 3 male development gene, putative [Plasmodium gallinaceum]